MNKNLTDAWAEAERTGNPIDIVDIVVCDLCNTDYTDSALKGGFLFGSKGVCPVCAPRFEGEVHACGEGRYIRGRAEPGETFKAFVLRIRAGNNTVSVTSFRL